MHASSGFPHSSQLSISSFPPVEPDEPVILLNSFQTHLTYFDILCFSVSHSRILQKREQRNKTTASALLMSI